MSDGQLLLFIFTLIYASDSVAWFGEREFLFFSFYGKNLLVRRHRFFFPGFKTGFSFLNPIPFLGEGYVAGLFPFSLSGTGISPVCPENPNPGHEVRTNAAVPALLWKDVEKVGVDQKKLLINRRVYHKFSSPQSAHYWKGIICRLKDSNSKDNLCPNITNLVTRYLDPRRPEKRLRIFRKATWWLRIYSNLLFVVVFIALPLTYIIFRESIELLYVCLIMWTLMLSISIETFCIHRRLYAKDKGDRIQHLFLSLFLPNITIRSVDFLSKRFFHDTHPLSLAKAAASDKELVTFESAFARDLNHPIPFQEKSLAEDVCIEFRDQFFQPAILKWFPNLGDSAQSPIPENAEAYCPRCLVEYATKEATCEDCGGIKVVS